jgi:hypothetical protein
MRGAIPRARSFSGLVDDERQFRASSDTTPNFRLILGHNFVGLQRGVSRFIDGELLRIDGIALRMPGTFGVVYSDSHSMASKVSDCMLEV